MAVRRVRRIVRKFDPWTVMKVSLVFYAVLGLVFVLAVVILWAVISNAGFPQKIESFLKQISLLKTDAVLFKGSDQYLRVVVFLAVVWTALMSGLTTLAAVIYNLISDVVGGIEIVVLEETLNVPVPPVVRAPQIHTTPPPSHDDLPTAELPAIDLTDQSIDGEHVADDVSADAEPASELWPDGS
jgi:ABC-type multidrug transport system fused ATPase/permease subunit